MNNAHQLRSILCWKQARWLLIVSTTPLVWWACVSHPLTQPHPQPEQETDVEVTIAPVRQLDLVFMIDNSPSMAPKQAKLQAQFPRLIRALEDENNNNKLPDLRIAIINSDLGTGGAYDQGNCGAKTLSDGTYSNYGDLGRFQMIGARDCGVSDDKARWLEYTDGKPVNFVPRPGEDINAVFACLAGGLGTNGCGLEHQLQAFEFALVAGGLGNEEQHKMLRREAFLGLVFLSDEDDCSAYPNLGLFGEKAGLAGESASLRCSTRSYTCKGQKLASTPGYPTTQSFEASLSDCTARTDFCPSILDLNTNEPYDTSQPTDCDPLTDYRRIAREIKSLKDDPDHQILVAGIFGWPLAGEMKNAEPLKIALRPNPNLADKAHPQVYDYWPICYDPNHRPNKTDAETGFDEEAAGWGSGPGIRQAAFVDEFGQNGMKFSICETDYTQAMGEIGEAIMVRMENLCVDYKLWKDPETGAPDCRVAYRKWDTSKNPPVLTEVPESLPMCDADYSLSNPPPESIGDCWRLEHNPTKCPVNGQLVTVLRTAKEVAAGPIAPGTRIAMQCLTCTDRVEGLAPVAGCE